MDEQHVPRRLLCPCRREIKELRKKKPVIASMGDVAASGACTALLVWGCILHLCLQGVLAKHAQSSHWPKCCAGGYYLSMAADVIVAQPLTITGSIGVVLAKFNLEELYRRVGYTKTPISRGQCVASRI